MQGVCCPKERLHENPLFMRVRRTPSFVTMRLWGGTSQWEKLDFHRYFRKLCRCRGGARGFQAGQENPVVRNNATLGWHKSMGKARFPQLFQEIMLISSVFAGFC